MADPNADPDVCLDSNPNTVPGSVKDVITEGANHDGDIIDVRLEGGHITPSNEVEPGDITDIHVDYLSAAVPGTVTRGALTLYVSCNGGDRVVVPNSAV